MKQYKMLQAVMAILMTAVFFSCTPLQHAGADDEHYAEARPVAPNRVFVDDPYYGTIVLERDPWSGRYFQVGPGGFYPGWNNGFYQRGFNNNRFYHQRGNLRRDNAPRNYSQQRPPVSNEQKQQERQEIRKRILGGRN